MYSEFVSTEYRSAIADCIPSGICVIDRNLRVRDWNQTLTRWTGISRDQIKGEKLNLFYPHLDESRFRCRINQVFECHAPVTFSAAIHKRFIAVRATGVGEGLMYQETVIIPLPGHQDRAAIVIQDVTARYLQTEDLRRERASLRQAMDEIRMQATALQAAQQRASQASQAKSEFLANVSHEIRTPMTAILGFTDVLLDEDSDEHERRRCAEIIRSNGRHLLQLINDILDLSRIEAGRLEIDEEPCHLPSLLNDVVDSFQHRAHERGLAFNCHLRKDVPLVVITDPLRLKQVLINLLGNALKFTEAGRIDLCVSLTVDEQNARQLRFDITDTGIGMSKQQISRLFQPFVQVDSSATRRFSGTGLGLAICDRVVDRLGGKIEVTSSPDVGSTFTVRIPLVAATPELTEHSPGTPAEPRSAAGTSANTRTNQDADAKTPAVAEPAVADSTAADSTVAEPASNRPLAGLRILLAEDGPDNQRLIAFRMRREGVHLDIAENGQQALERFKEARGNGQGYDVVLMDMQMPVMDGYEAARQLRKLGTRVPIIALTAHAMSHDRRLCLQAGCSEYHTKPVDWNVLRSLIVTVVNEYDGIALPRST